MNAACQKIMYDTLLCWKDTEVLVFCFLQRQKATLGKAQWNILPRWMTDVMNTGHEAEMLAPIHVIGTCCPALNISVSGNHRALFRSQQLSYTMFQNDMLQVLFWGVHPSNFSHVSFSNAGVLSQVGGSCTDSGKLRIIFWVQFIFWGTETAP